MKISFDSLEEQNIQNFKGGEGVFKPRMHVGNYNKIMRATLPAGSSIGLHTHDINSEIIFIISGACFHSLDNAFLPIYNSVSPCA